MMRLLSYLRPAAIVGPLPVTLVNGTVPDANQVMSDFNWIVSQVNANATQGAGSIAKNVIYNGDMSLAQRIGSNGSLAIAGGTKAYALDRWQTSVGGSSSLTVAQFGTTGLGQFRSAMRVQRVASNTDTSTISFAQSMESVDSVQLQGQAVTLSLWARAGANYSSAGNALTAQLWTGTGTDENVLTTYTGGAATLNTNLTITNSWARYQVSGTLPSTMTEFAVLFAFTPSGTAGAADNVDITGVQVEIGSAASNYDFRPFVETVSRCHRYYQKSFLLGTAPAQNVAGGLVFVYPLLAGSAVQTFTMPLLGLQRSAGTVVLYNPAAANAQIRNGTQSADFTSCTANWRPTCIIASGTSPLATAVGDLCEVHWTSDAEL